jgi:hypothetical protein
MQGAHAGCPELAHRSRAGSTVNPEQLTENGPLSRIARSKVLGGLVGLYSARFRFKQNTSTQLRCRFKPLTPNLIPALSSVVPLCVFGLVSPYF